MRNNGIDLSFDAEEARIVPRDYKMIQVNTYQVSKREVLDQFSIEDMLYHFNYDDILDGIGSDYCKKYFDLIEGENE